VRILHVQETLSLRYGGPARALPQMAKAQSAAGHEVVVVTTNADHPTGVYHEPGWHMLADGAVSVLYGSAQSARLRISAQAATYLMRSISGFDVVHVHGLYRFPPTLAARLARRRRIPYIIRPHGSQDPYLYDKSTMGSVRLKRLYERLFDLPNLNAAAAIHYTTEEERDRASFLGLRAPSFVLPNGLDWESYRELPARGALRSRWGLGDAPLVLFLGRLHFKKGLDLLIPAFDAVRRQQPNAQLVIAGPENDDYGQKLRDWVAERELTSAVHFVGTLQGADVVQAYVDADVFALPSYTENFGMTVAEAMACALPVVISDQVNIHAEISSAGAGLVTRCDIEEIADALQALLRDAGRRRVIGQAGRQLVQERYSWPAIVDALTKEYQSAIKRTHTQR
jgi:glycosyltransferase involved in cell wall biosynthesis